MEIKLEKLKEKTKKVRFENMLGQTSAYKVTQDVLAELSEDSMEVKLVSKLEDKKVAYIEPKTEMDVEPNF